METKNCQNCKKDFVIEPEDFLFYEKMKVPAPTFCPECRLQRRMSYRNDRSLYTRDCDMCKKKIISMYSSDAKFPVFCKECWYSDKWDSSDYARDYDFSKTFFQQWLELSNSVPHLAIWQRNAIDSPYSNMVAESRNVYLSISVVLGSENVFYSWGIDKSFNIFDCHNLKESNSCYENIEGEKNYNSQYLFLSKNCIDSYYLVDCANCSNCFLCSNLRNKEFYIQNKRYSKEEYFRQLEKFNISSRESRKFLLSKFNLLLQNAIYRFAHTVKAIDSTGNNLFNVKNCSNSFELYNVEDSKYCYRVLNEKDVMDVTYAGKAELLYEYLTGALYDYNVKFSISAIDSVQDTEYSEFCISSKNIFGSMGIRNKKNVILNKIYNEKDFNNMRERIIEHMNSNPYVAKNGIVYKYGEFFPTEISPFSYNETIAQDFFPLSKEQVIEKGYSWKDEQNKNNIATVLNEDIPDDIKDVNEDILKEAFECAHNGICNHHCSKAFKIIKDEFNFYKKNNIPIPDKCSNCRYYERFEKVLPPKLWHRKCMKEGCTNEFETTYAPERPEIVYCDRCYKQEVY
jgi:hypothetical protein